MSEYSPQEPITIQALLLRLQELERRIAELEGELDEEDIKIGGSI